jgi:hypothetical protein
MPMPQAIMARVVGSGTGWTCVALAMSLNSEAFPGEVALLAAGATPACAVMPDRARAKPGIINARVATKQKYRLMFFEMLKLPCAGPKD